MLNDPRFWFYLTVFFTAAGAARLIRRSPGRRVSPGGLLFLCLAAGALTAYWLFSDALFPSGGKILLILVLSALIPGALTGLCVPFILIPVILPVFLSWYLGVPPVPLVVPAEKPLGHLLCYPSPDGRIFLEWTDSRNPPVIGSLTGDRVAAVTAVITPPDYLFFLETRWILRGFATVNISPSRIPSSGSETFLLLETLPDRIPPGSSVTYPAWKFLSPGYFNSYSYTARGQTAIRITEGKREE